jgi:uncharacterized membrane protein YozB (DUF420 family)
MSGKKVETWLRKNWHILAAVTAGVGVTAFLVTYLTYVYLTFDDDANDSEFTYTGVFFLAIGYIYIYNQSVRFGYGSA